MYKVTVVNAQDMAQPTIKKDVSSKLGLLFFLCTVYWFILRTYGKKLKVRHATNVDKYDVLFYNTADSTVLIGVSIDVDTLTPDSGEFQPTT